MVIFTEKCAIRPSMCKGKKKIVPREEILCQGDGTLCQCARDCATRIWHNYAIVRGIFGTIRSLSGTIFFLKGQQPGPDSRCILSSTFTLFIARNILISKAFLNSRWCNCGCPGETQRARGGRNADARWWECGYRWKDCGAVVEMRTDGARRPAWAEVVEMRMVGAGRGVASCGAAPVGEMRTGVNASMSFLHFCGRSEIFLSFRSLLG